MVQVAIEIVAVTIENVADLRSEADEARHLASALDDPASIADLFKYAESLELDADRWEQALLRRANAANCLLRTN
jgi:hypothetical protein